MNLYYNEGPFPHIVAYNFYSDDQLKEVWAELDFLTKEHKLLPPLQTASAVDLENKPMKNNMGLWLEESYKPHYISDIIRNTNHNLFNKDLLNYIEEKHWVFKYAKNSIKDTTLLSYYENTDYYKPHIDKSNITALIHLFKEPQKFSGGDLIFDEYNLRYKTENNRMILFPSVIIHSVEECKMEQDLEKFSGNGRYCISKFLWG